MIIYCNGDSFVAGVGLADDMITGYPGFLPFNVQQQQQQRQSAAWHMRTYTANDPLSLERQSIRETIELLEKTRAFPSLLGKKYNYNVVSNAEGGASMARVSRTTVTDLIKLKDGNEQIVAILSTPPCPRFEVANGNLFWASILFGPGQQLHSNHQAVIDNKLQYETDYHQYTNFYINIISIIEFCKNNNIRLIWISSTQTRKLYDEKIAMEYNDVNLLVKHANMKYDIDMYHIAETCGLPNVIGADYHWGPDVHNIVADQLHEILK